MGSFAVRDLFLVCLLIVLVGAQAQDQDPQTELNAARNRWTAGTTWNMPSNYTFSYRPTDNGDRKDELIVKVRDDVLVSAQPKRENLSCNDDFTECTVDTYDLADVPTIPDLFDKIQTAIDDDGVQELTVTYKEEYGYPVSLSIVYSTGGSLETQINWLTHYNSIQRDLDDAMYGWKNRAHQNFTYELEISCFCGQDWVRPKIIKVDNGEIVQVAYSDTGEFLAEIPNLPTIDGLLTKVQNAIDNESYIIRVEFDRSVGYPTSLSITGNTAIADGSIYYEVLFFQDEALNQAQGELNSVKATWDSHSFDLYQFGFQRLCFCEPDSTQPLLVQVKKAEVTSVTTRGLQLVSESVTRVASSIEEIFASIQNAIDRNAVLVAVTYDEVYGYPKSLYIDYDARIADEELNIVIDYFGPIGSWQSDLDDHLVNWQTSGLTSYSYVFQRSCECLPADTEPKTAEVVDGVVVSAEQDIPTIDGLFVQIQQALDANAFRVDVEYDEEFGHPASIFVDYEELTADEEWIVTASSMQLITPEQVGTATVAPTMVPVDATTPTDSPTTGKQPTSAPITMSPVDQPSTDMPSTSTLTPMDATTGNPTAMPTQQQSMQTDPPSIAPATASPTKSPIDATTVNPTAMPTQQQSMQTDAPSIAPATASPTKSPMDATTGNPTAMPTQQQSMQTDAPSRAPVTASPTTMEPTKGMQTDSPTIFPAVNVTNVTNLTNVTNITSTPTPLRATNAPSTTPPKTNNPTDTPLDSILTPSNSSSLVDDSSRGKPAYAGWVTLCVLLLCRGHFL